VHTDSFVNSLRYPECKDLYLDKKGCSILFIKAHTKQILETFVPEALSLIILFYLFSHCAKTWTFRGM
jgi:hypothetical protein